MKISEELEVLGIEECPECHCATGTDWEYKDFSNKTIAICPQCKTDVKLDDDNRTIEILQHNISYWYDEDMEMGECDQEHVDSQIKEGMSQGQLVTEDRDGNMNTGWWKIDN